MEAGRLVDLVARAIPGGDAPTHLKVYDSYKEDPKWQIKFTIIWTSVLAFTTVASIPWVLRAARSGRLYSGLAIRESWGEKPGRGRGTRTPSNDHRGRQSVLAKAWTALMAIWQSVTLFTFPLPTIRLWKSQVADCCRRSYFSLSVGQMILVAAYLAAVIACFTVGVNLKETSNRPGFIAVAQLPVIVLLSLKSPLPIPVFLPSLSYEHYNFLHRWAGRTTWLAATVHGSMWINQYITTGQMDQVFSDKSKRGMITYAMMCMVVLTSLKPIRRKFYQIFWAAHVIFFVGFFAAVCYHTPYFSPWVYACAAIYLYDQFVRLLRYRIKDATIIPVDSTMTMIHIPDCDAGWLPTQHINVRVLRGAGIFESHPFTITNAPPSDLSGSQRGIVLYAKIAGDWTRRLHRMACETSLEIGDDYEEREAFIKAESEGKLAPGADHPGRRVTVMIDGPYGGLKLDLASYDTVLVVAGGSGVTFLLGTIEEALCLRERGQGPSKINVAWVVRDLCTIEALAPTMAHLYEIATRLEVELTYSLYLTNPPFPLPSTPAALPEHTTLSPYRPEVAQLVREVLPSAGLSLEDGSAAAAKSTSGGGLAVVAAGPEGLVREAQNAVASIGVTASVTAGGVGFHAEVYCL